MQNGKWLTAPYKNKKTVVGSHTKIPFTKTQRELCFVATRQGNQKGVST